MGTNDPDDPTDEPDYEDEPDDETRFDDVPDYADRTNFDDATDYEEQLDDEAAAEQMYHDEDDVHDEYVERPADEEGDLESEGGDYWGFSLGTLLLLVGLALFFIPEPATSTLGIVIAIVGVALLAMEAMS